MKKLQKLDKFKKFAILKEGIGIESQNLCKQFNDQKTIQTRWNSTVAIEQKVDSKAFAIPILTASAFIIYSSQNRDSKCFRINFLFYSNS